MQRSEQLSFEGRKLIDDVIARGYSEFSHGIPNNQIEELIEAYAVFTLEHPDPRPETMDSMLPAENTDIHKRLDDLERSHDKQDIWHKYRTNAPGVGKPDGYTNRSFQERALKQARGLVIPPEDPKEYFHFTPRWYANMARQHAEFGWSTIPPEVANLQQAFAPIHKKAAELILRVAGLIEENHPEIRNYFTSDSLKSSPVRLLFYHPSLVSQLGVGHYDKSSLTIQIAESHEGLRVAPNKDQDLQPVVRSDTKSVVFPGFGITTAIGEDTPFQPGFHDIVKIDRLNLGRSVPPKAIEVCARWALIFFANGSEFINPDKSQTHSR